MRRPEVICWERGPIGNLKTLALFFIRGPTPDPISIWEVGSRIKKKVHIFQISDVDGEVGPRIFQISVSAPGPTRSALGPTRAPFEYPAVYTLSLVHAEGLSSVVNDAECPRFRNYHVPAIYP